MAVPARPSPHWSRLGLLDGAPECVIETAWRWQIARHHPDRGGDAEIARAVNVARDALRGRGSKANEYVARHYESQPWLVLGVTRGAEPELARRVGAQLAATLETHRRLADRVAWAVANFGKPVTPSPGAAPRVRVTPPPRPPRAMPAAPRMPATPGMPEGLPARVDFGTLGWGAADARRFRLTWRRHQPYEISVDAPAPLRARVASSKAMPGRFAIELHVDWQHDAFTHEPSLRGHTLDGPLVVRWAGGGEARIPIHGVALYPAIVSVSPQSLDLGTVVAPSRRFVGEPAQPPARGALALISSAPAVVSVTPPAWLRRVDGSGRARSDDIVVATNTPVRVEFAVVWQPIIERAAASFAVERSVRPTGTISFRWGDRTLEVPAQVLVRPGKGASST
ncbi:MAG: hypothetical protein IVW36_05585 [Dehalococcoidia bacterium]|nr:hypothetical protein [Dehalococcoidia bacterium]